MSNETASAVRPSAFVPALVALVLPPSAIARAFVRGGYHGIVIAALILNGVVILIVWAGRFA